MIYFVLSFLAGGIIGSVISHKVSKKQEDIERLETLYHRCRAEMTRVYKQKDELAQRIKDMEADK